MSFVVAPGDVDLTHTHTHPPRVQAGEEPAEGGECVKHGVPQERSTEGKAPCNQGGGGGGGGGFC